MPQDLPNPTVDTGGIWSDAETLLWATVCAFQSTKFELILSVCQQQGKLTSQMVGGLLSALRMAIVLMVPLCSELMDPERVWEVFKISTNGPSTC